MAHTHVGTASGTPNELTIYGTDDLDDSCWLVANGGAFTDLESIR
ncbi:hypothetical protein [Natrialba sp. SSL1]|nr:hypothetical protein [Natrialba sp. SSL1]